MIGLPYQPNIAMYNDTVPTAMEKIMVNLFLITEEKKTGEVSQFLYIAYFLLPCLYDI